MSFTRKMRLKAVLTAATLALGAHSAAFAALPATGVSLTKHLQTLNLEPTNLGDFVKDKAAAIKLGKALFWDMSVGSDGVQACASCHFSAGADNRAKNQLSPGINRANQDASSNKDITFFKGGPNYTLQGDDFPFHKLSDPNDRNSSVIRSSNDIVSSQGVVSRTFVNAIPGFPVEMTKYLADPDGFQVNGTNVRRVEPRNTPTVINAVLNFRNFWDGRAQNDFNGVNPFGARDANAFLYKKDANGNLVQTKVSLNNSSLASQSVGPPQSTFEMSAVGRPFAKIGVKLLPMQPLARQLVASDDSVLGPLSRAPNKGLNVDNYKTMVKAAFKTDWYASSQYVRVNADGTINILGALAGIASKIKGENTYTQAEYNFSLFFGLAIQMYESTLISDQTRFDRYLDGDVNALNAQEKYGFELFGNNTQTGLAAGPARCANCHGGPETSDASIFKVSQAINTALFGGTGVGPIRRRQTNVVDLGFNNIGVTPTLEDLGVGGRDLNGNPLSVARQAVLDGANSTIRIPNPSFDPNQPEGPSNLKTIPFVKSSDVLGVDGAFKVPMLRNVELTAPYFHNGEAKTLTEVVEFYMRGGNHQSPNPINPPLLSPSTQLATDPIGPSVALKTGFLTGFDATRTNPVQIRPVGTLSGPNFDNVPAQNACDKVKNPLCEFPGRPLVEADKEALVAFLLSMTDERVKFRKAPFDHPELYVPNGQVGDETAVIDLFGSAVDEFTKIPAVGKDGGPQLPKFLGLEQTP